MCNLYTLHKNADAIRQLFADMGTSLAFPEGIPNLEPRDIHITDRAPIVRADGPDLALVERRWSWPAANGKPVYNLRSEGRNFRVGDASRSPTVSMNIRPRRTLSRSARTAGDSRPPPGGCWGSPPSSARRPQSARRSPF